MLALAVAQILVKRGDVSANTAAHLQLIEAAANEGVQLLVFPELSLTGYELDLARQLAFSPRDERFSPLCELAANHHMTVICGAPVQLEDRLYIGALIIAPDDSISLYTKHYLGAFPPEVSPDGVVPPAEDTVFHPGEHNPLLDVAGHRVAPAVCADTGRASHPERAAARGAHSYLASMFFTPLELEQECSKLRGYAMRHRMTVGFANFGGPSGGLAAAGSSALWSPQGALLAQLDACGTGLSIAMKDERGWRGRAYML